MGFLGISCQWTELCVFHKKKKKKRPSQLSVRVSWKRGLNNPLISSNMDLEHRSNAECCYSIRHQPTSQKSMQNIHWSGTHVFHKRRLICCVWATGGIHAAAKLRLLASPGCLSEQAMPLSHCSATRNSAWETSAEKIRSRMVVKESNYPFLFFKVFSLPLLPKLLCLLQLHADAYRINYEGKYIAAVADHETVVVWNPYSAVVGLLPLYQMADEISLLCQADVEAAEQQLLALSFLACGI